MSLLRERSTPSRRAECRSLSRVRSSVAYSRLSSSRSKRARGPLPTKSDSATAFGPADDGHAMAGAREIVNRGVHPLRGEPCEQRPRGEGTPRVQPRRGAKCRPGLEPEDPIRLYRDRHSGGVGHLVQPGRQAAFGRIVERGGARPGGGERGLDDQDSGRVESGSRRLQRPGRNRGEALRRQTCRRAQPHPRPVRVRSAPPRRPDEALRSAPSVPSRPRASDPPRAAAAPRRSPRYGPRRASLPLRRAPAASRRTRLPRPRPSILRATTRMPGTTAGVLRSPRRRSH